MKHSSSYNILPLDVPIDVDMDYAEVRGLKGKRMSRIVFGTLFLSKADDPLSLLDAVRQTGCNAFDCAAIYGDGECERLLGHWLRERKVERDDIVLITKGGCHGQDKLWAPDLHPQSVERHVTNSLATLGVSHVDIYMLHRDDPAKPVSEIVDMMHELQGRGCYTAWGVSNWDLPRLQAAIEYAQLTGKAGPICDSPQMSLAQPTRPVWPQTKYFTPASAQLYLEHDVAALGWEVLAKGFMTGKWERADGKRARAMQERLKTDPALAAALQPTGEGAAEWRELQLTTAYCTEDNFRRRERAEELARKRGLSVAQVALKYVASQPFNGFVLVGTTSAKHFGENSIGGSTNKLTPAEVTWLETGEWEQGSSSLDAYDAEADAALPAAKKAKQAVNSQSPEELVPMF